MNQNKEKRMVDTYEIMQSIELGDKEILFGVDLKNKLPYMVCNCTYDNPFNAQTPFDAIGGNDYLEMIGEYLTRATNQLDAVKIEKANINIPLYTVSAEDCYPNDYSQSIVNKVVAIIPETLRAEYRTVDNQLVYVNGGFGAEANSRGRAVYTKNLYSGKDDRWNRENILGEVREDKLPDWAKEKLAELQQPVEDTHQSMSM